MVTRLMELLQRQLNDPEGAGWSDVHIQQGDQVRVRRENMKLCAVDDYVAEKGEIERFLSELKLRDSWAEEIDDLGGHIDFGASVRGMRFRVNLHKFGEGMLGLVMRKINQIIPSTDDLHIPEAIVKMSRQRNGLILVTGATGSGKSTTLAALLDGLNREEPIHILTLEDPIEYMHPPKRAKVTQREVGPGKDCKSFATGLKAGLREDPDVIMVGEIRDEATAGSALEAAQTGHLVMATMHTRSAEQTVDRYLDMFPENEQTRQRGVLAASLLGIFCQTLLPGLERKRELGYEVLVRNTPVSTLIKENKMQQIRNAIREGQDEGMCLLNERLRQLVNERRVAPEDALRVAYDSKELEKELKGRRAEIA